MPRKVTRANQKIAKLMDKVFGGNSTIQLHGDEEEKSVIDILKSADAPVEGVTSYSTIGLSDSPLYHNGVEYPVRIEIVGACASSVEKFDNALGTAAFCIINSKWFCYPGAVFNDVLSMYNLSSSMQHFFFCPPFLWEDELTVITIGGKKLTWLLAVPISEEELVFCEKYGPDKLSYVLEENKVDIFDIERPSVI
ncbi:suppressor of fused domain protein [Desulfosarcina sp. OttesenSCG-928-B08]|nr:suppressor of fused domain protein [Desulfosarcina sp. OttesenSCG-928-B08]